MTCSKGTPASFSRHICPAMLSPWNPLLAHCTIYLTKDCTHHRQCSLQPLPLRSRTVRQGVPSKCSGCWLRLAWPQSVPYIMPCQAAKRCSMQVAEHCEAAQQQWPAVARIHSMAAHALCQLHSVQHAAGPPASAGGTPSRTNRTWCSLLLQPWPSMSQVMSFHPTDIARETHVINTGRCWLCCLPAIAAVAKHARGCGPSLPETVQGKRMSSTGERRRLCCLYRPSGGSGDAGAGRARLMRW